MSHRLLSAAALALAIAAPASSRAALDDFGVVSALIAVDLRHPTDGDFDVQGQFRPSAGAVVDPAAEAVTLHVGSFGQTIPAGRFQASGDGKRMRWRFKSGGGGLEVEIVQPLGGEPWAFRAKSDKADLGGTANPITVDLAIGDDAGSRRLVFMEKRDKDHDRFASPFVHDFALTKGTVTVDRKKPGDGRFNVQGTFDLGDGIADPVTEPVTLVVGSFTQTIAPGGFKR